MAIDVRKGDDAAPKEGIVRQYNDDEEKDLLWGLNDDIWDYVADEAEAIEGYADLLEKDNPYLTDSMRKRICAIIRNEKDHVRILMEISEELDGLSPNSNVTEQIGG
jgi:rubrerythrin